jgi:hypothetical protein
MYSSMHRRVSYALIALVGVAGMGGNSLHYLLQSWSESSGDGANGESVVVGHWHAPDFHWHTHVHHVHDEASEGNRGPRRDDSETNGKQARHIAFVHLPHACPLLSLVSQLKLGQPLARFGAAVDLPHCGFYDDGNHCIATNDAISFFARGPPLSAA